MEDQTMSRLLPFLAALTVGLLMVGVVAGAYFWHQRKRRKFSFTAKYLKQPSPTRDYCSPNFYMTPSVTVETQLSLCALVDDNFRIQPFSIYKEEAWPYNVIDASSNSIMTRSATDSSFYETLSSASLRNDNEILLQPEQLEDPEREPFYPSQSLYTDPINTSRSLTGEFDKTVKGNPDDLAYKRQMKRRDSQKRTLQTCQTPIMLETNSNSPYVQIQSLHDFPDSSNDDECQSQIQLNQSEKSTKRKGVVGGAVKKCKDAGNKVIARLPWKSGIKSTNQPISSSSSNRRLDRPIRALRQSLKGLRGSISHRRLHHTPSHKSSNDRCPAVLPPSNDDHN